jgi:hypothetical protein
VNNNSARKDNLPRNDPVQAIKSKTRRSNNVLCQKVTDSKFEFLGKASIFYSVVPACFFGCSIQNNSKHTLTNERKITPICVTRGGRSNVPHKYFKLGTGIIHAFIFADGVCFPTFQRTYSLGSSFFHKTNAVRSSLLHSSPAPLLHPAIGGVQVDFNSNLLISRD